MKIHELHKAANALLSSGDAHKAREVFIRICSLAPGDVQAWHMRSAISGMLGDFQDAISCSEQAIAINPDIAAVYANYGNALMQLNRHKDALDAFTRSINLDKNNPGTLNNMGTLYKLLGNNKQAESCYKQAINLSAGISDAHNNLAMHLLDTSQKSSAIKLCGDILTLDENNRPAFTILCNCMLDPGTFDAAFTVVKTITNADEDSCKLLYGAARTLHKQGQNKEAERLLSALIQNQPNDKRINMMLAICQVSNKSYEPAAITLETLEKLNLSLTELKHVSDLWIDTGKYDRAEAYNNAIKKHLPDEIWPDIKLARIDVFRGQHEKAVGRLETLLDKHPEAVEVLTELGRLHFSTGNTSAAISYNQQAIDKQPEDALAHNNMGVILKENHDYQEALACFKEAIRLDPDNLQTQCNLASAYSAIHQHEKALELFDAVLSKEPGNEFAMAGKSASLERTGDKDLAFQLVTSLVEAGSTNITTLNAYARVSSVAGMETHAIDRLESALQEKSLTLHERISVYFNLGRLHDHTGDYDKAFSRYKSGNDLSQENFDRDVQKEYTDMLVSAFSHDRMQNYPRSTNTSNKPVFIIGMPRSGTSLVEQILSAHPAVHGAGELTHIRNIVSSIKGLTGSEEVFPLNLENLTPEILDHSSKLYLQEIERDSQDEPFITDKMPANFQYIGLIELLFPNARIIHCRRNPIDTCLSCFFQQFRKSQFYSHKLSDTAFYYNCYRRLMDHWKSTVTIPILDIVYEDVVENQEEKSRELVDFLGLDWNPDCLDFHKTERKVITASYDQVRKPIYKSSAGRWKHYEAHLADLIDNLEYK